MKVLIVAKDVIITIIVTLYYLIKSLICIFIRKSEKKVTNDIVLVTGAGSGLGRLTAQHFAKLGSTVVAWDVDENANNETAKIIKENGGMVFAYKCDLCERQNVYKVAAKVKKEVGKVTILINNAGIVTGKVLLDCPDSMIEKTFAVNTLAHFWTVKAFLQDMMDMKKGHIVTIASIAGHLGSSQLVDYSASKFAAVGFNDALTAELRAIGFSNEIRTTVISPYFINKGMFEGVQSSCIPTLSPEKVSEIIVRSILTNTEIVLIPSYFNILMALKTIVPLSVTNYLKDVLGNITNMKTFKGRTK